MFPVLDPTDPYYGAPPRRPDVEMMEFCAVSDAPQHIQSDFWGIFSKQHAVTKLSDTDLWRLGIRRQNTMMMQFMNCRRIETVTGYDFSQSDQIIAASNSLWAQSRDGNLLNAVSTQKIETKTNSGENGKETFMSKLFNMSSGPETEKR